MPKEIQTCICHARVSRRTTMGEADIALVPGALVEHRTASCRPWPHIAATGTAQFSRISQKYRYSILLMHQRGKTGLHRPARMRQTTALPAQTMRHPPAGPAAILGTTPATLRFWSLNRMNKPFDLVVHGATGFTGRLVVEYLLQRYPQAAACAGPWAGAMPTSSPPCAMSWAPADTPGGDRHHQPASLQALMNATRLVLTTVARTSCMATNWWPPAPPAAWTMWTCVASPPGCAR